MKQSNLLTPNVDLYYFFSLITELMRTVKFNNFGYV